MKLVANGDSHTYGEGLALGDLTFADIVGNYYHMQVLNYATPGGSNDCILRTTGTHFYNDDYFILIGWTSWEREEWYNNLQHYQINSSGNGVLPPELHADYKEWVIGNNYKSFVQKSISWHNRIWDYHLALTNKGIKHLFFNSFTPFLELDIPDMHNDEILSLQKQDWNSCFINPYNKSGTYLEYLINKGCTPNRHYHFKADGHIAWGEFLINYIQQYKLL